MLSMVAVHRGAVVRKELDIVTPHCIAHGKDQRVIKREDMTSICIKPKDRLLQSLRYDISDFESER